MVIITKDEEFNDYIFGVSVLLCTQKTESKQVILASVWFGVH